jgi:hypothetical protein
MSLHSEYLVDETAPEVPRFDSPAVQLEKRGTTQQIHQHLLWAKCTIHKNTVAAKLREAGRNEDALKLENCHTRYTIAVCSGCNRVNKFPNRCDLFFCPECQPRLSQDRKKAVEWWTREVAQPKHVVLTVQNVPDLTPFHIQEFRRWFTNLRRSKFARNWTGGFYSLEVTNEGRGWHLHLHALIDAKWIDSFGLSEAWMKASRGMGRIVKVKDARQTNYLAEVTKYVVKGVQLAAWEKEKIVTFVTAFNGIRTFGVFGSLYGARTKFAEWWKQIREKKPQCECGCCSARYFSEAEWLEHDFVATSNVEAIPPPRVDLTIPLPFAV